MVSSKGPRAQGDRESRNGRAGEESGKVCLCFTRFSDTERVSDGMGVTSLSPKRQCGFHMVIPWPIKGVPGI